MFIQCYLRLGLVYIPTEGMIERGFYRSVEPVVAVSDIDALRRAFAEAIALGNPKVPLLERAEHPPPILPKYAGVKSWNSFARNTSVWGIDERDRVFKIKPYGKYAPGGWTVEEERVETFPAGTPAAAVIERMISLLQEADRIRTSK